MEDSSNSDPIKKSDSDCDIHVDTSGTLSEEFFYFISADVFSVLDDRSLLEQQQKKGFTVLHARAEKTLREPWYRVETTEIKESDASKYQCRKQLPSIHRRQRFVAEVGGDVYGGPTILDFVSDTNGEGLFVSQQFAQRLRRTNLRGYDLRQFSVFTNQSAAKDAIVFFLQAKGSNCERPLRIADDKNVCPFCRRTAVVCQECGHLWYACVNCGHATCITQEQRFRSIVADKRLTLQDPPINGGVLEVGRWSGTDFIVGREGTYFSRRAFDWMASIHVGPLMGIPARMCVDNMLTGKRAALKIVADVSTVKET